MKYCRLSRRQFLQGAGSFTLALPLLPSLLTEKAFAQSNSRDPWMILFTTSHGCVSPSDWRGDLSSVIWQAGEQQVLYPGDPMLGTDHRMHFKTLSSLAGGGALSHVFDSQFNGLLSKMNIIEGLDLMYGGGHQTGAHLGNFHGNDNADSRTGVDANLIVPPLETIDQLLASWSGFYPANDPRTMPVLNFGGGGWSPSFRRLNGRVQRTAHDWDIQTIFNNLFGANFGDPAAAAAKQSALNRVHEDYQRFSGRSNTRISNQDRLSLEQHMQSLADVERRLLNQQNAANCSTVGIGGPTYGPVDPMSNANAFHQSNRELFAAQWDIYVNIIVTAINCGLCRLFTVPIGFPVDYTGDAHQNVAHLWHTAPAQIVIRDAYQFVARHFVLPVLERLNDIDVGSGMRLLDTGTAIFQPECWYATHDGRNIPTMMAGSANNYFRTGYYIDYRNHSNMALQGEAYDWQTATFNSGHPYALHHPGVPFNRWLHTLLEAMGMNRSTYLQLSGLPEGTEMYGYGDHSTGGWGNSLQFQNTVGGNTQTVTHTAWSNVPLADCNSALPFLKA